MRLTHPKKGLASLLLAMALLLSGRHSSWAQAAPATPSTNAYDYYEQASQALVGLDKLVDATRPTATVADKEAIVQRNSKALELLHRGFAHPYHKPVALPLVMTFGRQRDLARLLALAGDVQAAHNDQVGATDNYLGALQLGVDYMRDAGVIAMLSSLAMESFGRPPLLKEVSKLTGQEAKAAARRLELVESHRVAYSDVLRTEAKSKQHDLTSVFADKNWRQELKTNVSEQQIAQDFTRTMDAMIADANLPYPARQISHKLPTDPVNQLMLSNYADRAGIGFLETKDRAQNALLMLMLALQAYKMEHQTYPQNLTQLVPEYLQKVPSDSFALNGPLRYKFKGDSYLLYSIGPDGKDDGGQPVYDPKDNPRLPYRVTADSVGDIVAGVNTH